MKSMFMMAIIAAVSATPTFAAEANPHAAHHPQTAVAPAPAPKQKAAAQGGTMDKCAMMQSDGSMTMGGGGKATNCAMMKTQTESKPSSP